MNETARSLHESAITIRVPSDKTECTACLKLVYQLFEARFGTHPQEPPHEMLAAFNTDGFVIGTIGFLYPTDGKRLEIEEYYELDIDLGERERTAQICRMAVIPDAAEIGQYLFAACHLYLYINGWKNWVSCNRRYITSLMRRYGYLIREIEYPLRKKVPDQYSRYFCDPADPVIILTGTVESNLPIARITLDEGLVEVALPVLATDIERWQ